MSKRVRKGISLLASFAMSAGLMVGVFAAPSAAVADSVTINTPTGVKAAWLYNQSLHGQLCDFYFNEGADYDYSYANEGVFINGTFAGPNAAEMELTDVTLIDMPATSDNDDYELVWVDFNRSDRSGFDFDDLDSNESQECSSDHDFEVYMEDSSEGESEFSYWDVAGDYTYRLTFANSFNEGNGSVTLTQDVTITVAGEAVSSELELSANGGDATDSVIWPIHSESSDFDGYFEGGYDTDTWVAANLRYYDADGNVTHLDDYNTNWEYSYIEGDVADAAWATADFYQVVWSESDWGEELWIMSNDYTSEYQIHDEVYAEEYNEDHENEFGYDFGSTPAYFALPNTDEGEEYYFLDANDWEIGEEEFGWVQGLVDEFGDFTDGPQITFYVGSDIADVSTFWVRTTDVLADLGESFDSNSVSVDFRGWVDGETIDDSTTVALGDGIARAQNWSSQYDDTWFIRTDVDSVNYVYAGGEDNAGLFIDFNNYSGNDYTTNSALEYNIDSDGAQNVLLTNAAGGVTVTVDVSDNVDDDEVNLGYGTFSSDIGEEYTIDELLIRAPGYYPQFRLQNTSTMSVTTYGDEYNDDDGTNAPYVWNEYVKSYVFGSTLTLTYKVTDAWNTPITNYGVWLAQDEYLSGKAATFDVFDDFNLTDANGLVSFTVTNDQTSDEIAEYHNCEDVDNCQEDHNADTTEMWREAFFYAYADTFASVDEVEESDYLLTEFVRSITVDDLNLYTEGTDEDGIHIDTEGDELEQIYASVEPVNADGVGLSGLPYSISASEGGYFLADSMLCEEGVGYDYIWTYEGCDDSNYIDYATDAIDVSQFASGSASGTASRKLHEFHLTGTLVGTTTFTITVGGVSEEISQDYYNLVEDARFIANVAGDANSVIAGNVATATFKVTDRFGNAVEDVYVTFSENSIAEFAMNDDDGANGTTDANGLVSVDVVTPANSMSSGTVTAEFVTEQDPLEDEDFGIDAAVESADATVSWTHITPTITVKALKYRAGVKVFVKNAVGNVTRVFVDGKMKRVFVPATVNGYKKLLLKKGGKRTVVVTVASPLGNIFETFELKLKKNKK